MINILVVEDDIKLNRLICTYMDENGYSSEGCLNPVEAYNRMNTKMFDLIISDIMMPEIDGFEFAKAVRAVNETIPMLFVSAKDDFVSKQRGFNAGIDDYMVKPIDMNELVLRVSALLRRSNIKAERKIVLQSLVLDADAVSAQVNDIEIPVTFREFNILYKLLSYPKKTFSRAQLIDEFWDSDGDTSLRAVDVYITKLRDKFSSCSDFKIITVHGLGYKAVIE